MSAAPIGAAFPRKMKLNNNQVDIRVFVFRLILTIGLVASGGGFAAGKDASRVDTSASLVGTTASLVGTEVSEVYDVGGWSATELGSVDRDVFQLALRAAETAIQRGDAADASTLTVIDFSKPSPTERMWVYDLRTRELLFEEVVSHGRGSGKTMATAFSNRPSSNQSSIGLYRTAETYIGKHGYSLRLDGLDEGFNDNARRRAIVMHAADYVNPAAAQANGYLGRSLGCPAVRPEISRALIDAIKNGGLLFAYYPDEEWLAESVYLP